MLTLSLKTKKLIRVIFRDKSDDDRRHIGELLQKEIGPNLPFCESSTPEDMERLRFAVIRQISERRVPEALVIDLAKRDWRDLLMAADFGHDANAHLTWCDRVMGNAAGN